MKTGTETTLLEQRLSGTRPEIEIAGNTYLFYLEEMLLRPKIPSRMTSSDLLLTDSDKHENGYRFLLNTNTGAQLAAIPANSLDFPKEVRIIEVPFPVVIDPVGFAQTHGIPYEKLLKLYPIRNDIKAKEIPWQTTRFTRLIEENNWTHERAQKEKVERKVASGIYQAKNAKQVLRKNKGKHL